MDKQPSGILKLNKIEMIWLFTERVTEYTQKYVENLHMPVVIKARPGTFFGDAMGITAFSPNSYSGMHGHRKY
jgi:hypothetical protein